MSESTTAYRFDEQGYLLGTCLINKNTKGAWAVPADATITAPTLKSGYWSRWKEKKWGAEKIPTTCADAIDQNLTCISNGPGLHNLQVKAVIETLVANESENYRTVVSSDFVMSIEAIPEPTLDELKEKKLDELTAAGHRYDNQLVNEDMIINSSLGFKANADLRSQNNINGLIAAGQEPVAYMDSQNTIHSLALAQLNTLLAECIENGQYLYQQKWSYREKINACTTKEELAAITFEFKMMDFSNE